MPRTELEGLSREELIARAEAAGVVRPRTLTIPELIDEILQANASNASGRSASTSKADKRGRGWFGRARDLLTSVIDRGIHAPETRAQRPDRRSAAPAPPPLPTMTLAEIYAAQGHLERAIATLDEVIAREPSHAEAAALRARFEQQLHKTKPSTPPPVIEAKLEAMPASATPMADVDAKSSEPLTDGSKASRTESATLTSASTEPSTSDTSASPAGLDSTVDAARGDKPATVPPAPLRRPTTPPVMEVDEIVGLAVDPNTVYLYWEVRPSTLAAARAAAPEGALVVRAVTVQPALSGPATDVRDFRVDALFGELFVHGLPSQANVRVSVGYKSGSAFEPFAIGMDLTTPRTTPAREVATTFRKWSDAGRAVAPPRSSAAMDRGGAMPDYGAEGSDLVTRFPAGVWVDPTTRVVRVVGTDAPARQGSDVMTHTFVVRPDGSSEILRRQVAWSSNEVVWASRTAHRS